MCKCIVRTFFLFKSNFYTYQLNSSKVLQLLLKDMECDVAPVEISKSLED